MLHAQVDFFKGTEAVELSFRVPLAKVCHCESRVRGTKQSTASPKLRLLVGPSRGWKAGLPVIPNRQAGSLSHRLLMKNQPQGAYAFFSLEVLDQLVRLLFGREIPKVKPIYDP